MNRHFSAITGGMLLPMWIFANAVVATQALPSLITTDIEDAQVVKIPVPIRSLQVELVSVNTSMGTTAGSDGSNTAATTTTSSGGAPDLLDCARTKHVFDDHVHKPKYRIAVDAVRGIEASMNYFNSTFSEYLTATAGKRFDPPIHFELVALNYTGFLDAVLSEQVDLTYSNPGSASCVSIEADGYPIATTISRVATRGIEYELDVYGGVIFTKATNEEINTITDLKDKIIGAGDITDTQGGQTQLHEMVKAGMSPESDPKQVVFTGNQFDVVTGVLHGDFDVGFVRTDQIEKTVDENGVPVDPKVFKVIDPKIHILDNGNLFPFLHSTDVYPEWPVSALKSLPSDVAREVQDALIAMREHALPTRMLTLCLEEEGLSLEECQAEYDTHVTHCDTTPELSELAYLASTKGEFSGFRTPTSYSPIRTMQEAARFINKDEKGKWRCDRKDSLRDAVTCPAGYYKLSKENFDASCKEAGLACKEGYSCYCKPCIQAFEVDVYQHFPGDDDADDSQTKRHGCPKMSVCGTAEQTKRVTLRAVDNMKRDNATFTAVLHVGGQEALTMNVEPLNGTLYSYELSWSEAQVGVDIIELFVDGVQIPQSPIRVQITERSCDLEFPGAYLSASETGTCICSSSTVLIAGNCVPTTILSVVLSIVLLGIVIVLGAFFIQYKNHKNDQVWHIDPAELIFDNPIEIIGEGAFGVVMLGTYRGTKVAIKRALKPKTTTRGSSKFFRGSVAGRTSVTGEGRVSALGSAVSLPRSSANSIGLNSIESGVSDDGDAESPKVHISGFKESQDTEDTPSSNPPSFQHSGVLTNKSRLSVGNTSKKSSGGIDLGFLADRFGTKGRHQVGWFPWMRRDNRASARFKEVVLGESGSLSKSTLKSQFMPCIDKQSRRRQEFIAEMRLLSRLRHPCITTVMGAVVSKAHVPMLVMEFMENGSLNDLLHNETMHLTGEVILQIMRDVAQGIRYLHSSKPPILHGDLKSPNILIDNRFRAKVCDFGLSVKKKDTISGSLFWLPPEYLCAECDYNAPCDMYSIGIILNEIYSRTRPYGGDDLNLKELLVEICDRKINKRPPIPETCPPKMSALMQKLWNADPNFRPRAAELDMTFLDMAIRDAEPITQDQLNAKPRTEEMLYELFPKHIAEAIKSGKKVEPEQHDLVTIVFSDIVHFTDISREITPIKVSMMLDRLYLAFDRIAKKHKVFKVETIGDAYMGVTNLVENQIHDHVKHIAEFAIDMVHEASQILIDEDEPERGFIQIRVGFHSGPVVANIIGSSNPRFGLFGDSVNTASRMESNSVKNRILCSEASFHLLKKQAPEIPVKKRGKIPVKGKGDMTVFWVGDSLLRAKKKGLDAAGVPCEQNPSHQVDSMAKSAVLKDVDDPEILLERCPRLEKHVRIQEEESSELLLEMGGDAGANMVRDILAETGNGGEESLDVDV